ncbi:MAG: exonuclease subunit SbcD [Clostridia bacterium]|nr:exonuclease subunit SbcD [Clostridia bacterium]
MKFLHTSDLHIGKKLDGVSRLDEQKAVLDEILSIAVSEKVDMVLVAGDVYDTFIPSADAENLFFNWLDKFAENAITLVCISGNHDDADRLSAAKTIASRRGLYLCGSSNDFLPRDNGKISLIESGKNHLVFKDEKGEEFFIATLSFFGEAPTGYVIDKEKDYSERVGDILKEIFSFKKPEQNGVLVSHLFMLGGESSESERRIDLGGVKVVSPSAIPSECIYTALGHLHKRQIASKSKNVIYSGSPLQYSYDEVGIQKSVTLFEVENGAVLGIKTKELLSGKKLAKLTVVGTDSLDEKLSKIADKFVDLTIISERPLTMEETAKIKTQNPNVTKIKLEFSSEFETGVISGRKELSDKDLFVEFYTKKYGANPDDELIKAYLEIMAEE